MRGFFFRWRAIIGLAGSDIEDQLTELARVARGLRPRIAMLVIWHDERRSKPG
jgi:hypothetical protein